MRESYKVICNTKNHKDATAVESTVTFAWDPTWSAEKRLETLEQLAIDSLTIKWQSTFRNADKDGVYKVIPATANVVISEPGRKSADPDKTYRDMVVKVQAKKGLVVKSEDVTQEQIDKVKAFMAAMEI